MRISFGFKPFCCMIHDREGNLCTVFGKYEWERDKEGLKVTYFDFFPFDPDLKDSVEDWINSDIKD